jgi:phospholipase/lecithinase/hemolysin
MKRRAYRYFQALVIASLLCVSGVGAAVDFGARSNFFDPIIDFFSDRDRADEVRAIFVFGDSISDTGNVFLATDRTIPVSPPYFEGRFSNGPVWVERLAAMLGFDAAPILAGGTNFAVGGARAGRDVEVVVDQETFTIPSILSQVDLFFGARTNFFDRVIDFFIDRDRADSDALYILFIGGNDIRDVVLGLDGGLDAMGTMHTAVMHISTAIRGLADEGARTFLVPNLANVGLSPETVAAGLDAVMLATELTVSFNSELQAALDALEAELGITIFRLDTFALLEDIVANPAAFGLTNVTDPCLDGNEFIGGIPCAAPAEHLFWDSMHATAVGHAILADAALAVIAALTAGVAGDTRGVYDTLSGLEQVQFRNTALDLVQRLGAAPEERRAALARYAWPAAHNSHPSRTTSDPYAGFLDVA